MHPFLHFEMSVPVHIGAAAVPASATQAPDAEHVLAPQFVHAPPPLPQVAVDDPPTHSPLVSQHPPQFDGPQTGGGPSRDTSKNAASRTGSIPASGSEPRYTSSDPPLAPSGVKVAASLPVGPGPAASSPSS